MRFLRWFWSWTYVLFWWAATWVTYPYRLWQLYKVKRDPNLKCPACGDRNGSIRWDPTVKRAEGRQGALVHTCKTCTAQWGEAPIVDSKDWQAQLPVPQGDTAPWSNGKQSKSFEGLKGAAA